jgi:hypothetical protein
MSSADGAVTAPARVTQIIMSENSIGTAERFLLYPRGFPGKIAEGTAIPATGVVQ